MIPHPPITVAGRTLLAEIEHWRGVAAADRDLGAVAAHELTSLTGILLLARHMVPTIEAEAAALATSREPAFPPVVTK